MSDIKKFLYILAVFLIFYFVPVESVQLKNAIMEALYMTQDYARQHVLLCLIPAFLIAGAIAVFIKSNAVLKYLGAKANKFVAYTVASVSGSVLAVCSCTVLPLFAGIYKRGAGIGPATAFLYSGPAINVLAIILTARVLGLELGIARIVGAVVFSVIIGLLMQLIFSKEEEKRMEEFVNADNSEESMPAWKLISYFAVMIAILVFLNWGKDENMYVWNLIYRAKWIISGVLIGVLAFMVFGWFKKDEIKEWGKESWGFAVQILPLLFMGVLAAGFLLGRPGHEALIPSSWIVSLVGGNSIWSNLFASVAGALMYFATLTEVPILQGLIGAGMGKGPALALLLAGPALSLPNMIVINSIMGLKKTAVYIGLVVIMAALTGMLYGFLF
ncbi:MAG TPA: permease [Candidatus Goldiibacteriota bacterium]|nr:permease [Candidatus Goldiibacteriota bacterium]